MDSIICFTVDPWGEMKRPGQLMRRFARRVPVLYVEAPLSITSLIKDWRSPLTRSRLRRGLSRRTHEAEPGIHVLSSLIVVPPHRLSFLPSASLVRWLERRQQRAMFERAHSEASRLGMSFPVVWMTMPGPLMWPRDRESAVLVYDCMDRWSDFPDILSDADERRLVAEQERQLLAAADVVFCSAAGLFESKRRMVSGAIHLVRNGADVEHFVSRGRSVPTDMVQLPRPIVGYVGAVADWIDFELLRAVARLRPQWSFVLIGPVFKGMRMGDTTVLRPILDVANVYLLGPRAYEEVPAYLEAFDVATIPFKLNGLTEDTNPIKVYEYLAAGVPVVSTPLPEVLSLPGVGVASTAAEFVEQCEIASRVRSDADALPERVGTAVRNSWEARAEVAWAAISEFTGG
ncbi:MAG TPA: glycosyltransferase [Thermoleophilia bacterium]|nr:glycosyltransferase [Thermoleophilia bacterium]